MGLDFGDDGEHHWATFGLFIKEIADSVFDFADEEGCVDLGAIIAMLQDFAHDFACCFEELLGFLHVDKAAGQHFGAACQIAAMTIDGYHHDHHAVA